MEALHPKPLLKAWSYLEKKKNPRARSSVPFPLAFALEKKNFAFRKAWGPSPTTNNQMDSVTRYLRKKKGALLLLPCTYCHAIQSPMLYSSRFLSRRPALFSIFWACVLERRGWSDRWVSRWCRLPAACTWITSLAHAGVSFLSRFWRILIIS